MSNQIYKFSDLKQALKQGAPQSLIDDIVAQLSPADINKAVQTFNPGVEQILFNALPPDLLQKVASSLDPATAAHLMNLPPEFLAFGAPVYNDTAASDHFAASGGTFQATDINQNTLTYGISGASATAQTVGAVTYDLTAGSDYGTLLLNSHTGQYLFQPDDQHINALTVTAMADFAITVFDGAFTTMQAFDITLNGVNDTPALSGSVHADVHQGDPVSTLDALGNVTDADANTTLLVTGVPGQLPAGVQYDAAHHAFSFDSSDSAYAGLAKGVIEQVSVDYSITDGTATVNDSVSWTVTGTREAPMAGDDVLNSGPPGSGWALDSDNGHYYRLVTVGGGVTWYSAESAAHADGAYLATITSAAEQQFAQTVANGHGAWLGGYGSIANQVSSWHWVDGPESGSALTYSDWHPGEPNGGFGFADAALHMEADGGWNDVPTSWGPGNSTLTGYLEEWGGLPAEGAYASNAAIDISTAALLGNDSSVQPGAVLSLGRFDATSADGATISLNSDGTLHYDPTTSSLLQQLGGHAVANDTFTYTVKDQYGLESAPATVTIPVHGVPAGNVVHTADGGSYQATSAADYFVIDPNTYVWISGFDTAKDKLVFEHTAADGGTQYQYSDAYFSVYGNSGGAGGVEVQSIAYPGWGPYTAVSAWDANNWAEADLSGLQTDPHTFYDHNVIITSNTFVL